MDRVSDANPVILGAEKAGGGIARAGGRARAGADAAARSTRWAPVARVAVLLAVDAAALAMSGAVAYFAWARPVHGQSPELYLQLLPLILVFLVGYWRGGLYPGFAIGGVETLRQMVVRTSFIYMILAAGVFALKLPHHYSRATFAIAWLSALLLLPLLRFGVLGALRRVSWWSEPAVLVGPDDVGTHLSRALARSRTFGFRIRASVPAPGPEAAPQEVLETVAAAAAAAGHSRVVLVAENGGGIGPLLDLLQQHFQHVIVVRAMGGDPTQGVRIRDLGGLLGIEFENRLLDVRRRVVKRTLDLVLGSVALVLASPVMALAAVAVKIISPGPAFFGQDREGLGGGVFRLKKLRTMWPDAEARLAAHLAEDPAAREEWEGRFKLARDPRVLPLVGRLMRRLSIDELPQLFNVLRGDMSLVGPRPLPAYHIERFPELFLAMRRRVRPGMTGLWQVMDRGDETLVSQQAYDMYYIRNWSLWMDVYVLARTVFAVVSGRGAY